MVFSQFYVSPSGALLRDRYKLSSRLSISFSLYLTAPFNSEPKVHACTLPVMVLGVEDGIEPQIDFRAVHSPPSR